LIDPLLLLVVANGLWLLHRGAAPPARTALRVTAPWIALIAAGTLLSLYSAGLQPWAGIDMAQTGYSLAIFFGMFAVMWTRREFTVLFACALSVGIAVTTVDIALAYAPGFRPSGLFYHPNYAGHFLVAAAIVCWFGLPWRPVRWAVLLLAAVGVFLTASFGALLMVIVFLAYTLAPFLRTRPAVVLVALAALIAGLWLGAGAIGKALTGDVQATDTLSESRLERSASGRLAVWSESLSVVPYHPLGVGPDGLHNRGLIDVAREPHNLYVAYLAERGVIGLVGVLGLGFTLWRLARPRGIARGLLLAFAAGNLVRETMHYRHMWVILALALVLDQVATARDARSTVPSFASMRTR
jgi:O-antigen ligase